MLVLLGLCSISPFLWCRLWLLFLSPCLSPGPVPFVSNTVVYPESSLFYPAPPYTPFFHLSPVGMSQVKSGVSAPRSHHLVLTAPSTRCFSLCLLLPVPDLFHTGDGQPLPSRSPSIRLTLFPLCSWHPLPGYAFTCYYISFHWSICSPHPTPNPFLSI